MNDFDSHFDFDILYLDYFNFQNYNFCYRQNTYYFDLYHFFVYLYYMNLEGELIFSIYLNF